MKFYSICFMALLTTGCGGGGGGDNVSEPVSDNTQAEVVSDCIVENDTITLASGAKCNITDAIASTYSLTAGEISCDDSTLTLNGSTFTSANAGIIFNGLTFMCSSS